MSTPEQLRVERRATSAEHLFAYSPFAVVTLAARIEGEITGEMLRRAVAKVRQRHTNLRVRVVEADDGSLWFTSDGAGDLSVEVVPRKSADHWVQVHHESAQCPFEFDVRPPIRFVLVQSPDVSELLIICHHIICDGLSLAYLARDILLHLGDPAREVEVLPDPAPVTADTLPPGVSPNAIVRYFVNRINRKWRAEMVAFDQADYRSVASAYWSHFQHHVIPVEFGEDQTSALVRRCRAEGVTVNSALAAAFVGGQVVVQGEKPYLSSVGVAASVRDRLREPVGEAMGFYAGAVTPRYRYDTGKAFWENARRFHRTVQPLYDDRHVLNDFSVWSQLEPTFLEAITLKKLGRLVPPGDPRYDKLAAFSARDDVVLAQLKRDNMASLDDIFMGTAVTNLTRMDFPRTYGPLTLDRLILQPGGAFPLSNVGLVLGAVTCSGKLSLLAEYAEQAVATPVMEQIVETAMGFLLGD